MAPYPFSSILYLDRYPLDSFSSWFSLVFDGLVGIWVVWYFVEELIQIYREGYREYFSQFWNFIDILNLLLFFESMNHDSQIGGLIQIFGDRLKPLHLVEVSLEIGLDRNHRGFYK